MESFGNEYYVNQGEDWNLDKLLSASNKEYIPYIISSQRQNPFFVVTVGSTKFEKNLRYVKSWWNEIGEDTPKFYGTNPVYCGELEYEDSSAVNPVLKDLPNLPGIGEFAESTKYDTAETRYLYQYTRADEEIDYSLGHKPYHYFYFEYGVSSEFVTNTLKVKLNLTDETGLYFELRFTSMGDNSVIDWGDGTIEQIEGAAPTVTHTYLDVGEYIVKVNSPNYLKFTMHGAFGQSNNNHNKSVTEIEFPDNFKASESANRIACGCDNCDNLSSVKMSKSINVIDEYAFSNCINLKKVVFSTELSVIHEYAFDGCAALTSIVLPRSVGKVGHNAFSNCSSLKTIYLPDSIAVIFGNSPSYGIIYGSSSDIEVYCEVDSRPTNWSQYFNYYDDNNQAITYYGQQIPVAARIDDYECHIRFNFSSEDTQAWVGQDYIYQITLVDGILMAEKLNQIYNTKIAENQLKPSEWPSTTEEQYKFVKLRWPNELQPDIDIDSPLGKIENPEVILPPTKLQVYNNIRTLI